MGIKRGGDLALSVLSAHLTGQRPGQMSDCFLDFLATDTYALTGTVKPEADSMWSVVRIMEDPLRRYVRGECGDRLTKSIGVPALQPISKAHPVRRTPATAQTPSVLISVKAESGW